MKRSLAAAAALVVLALGACSNGDGNDGTDDTTTSTVDQSLKVWKTKPPWPLGDRQADRIAEAGLPALTSEGNVVHFHAHLDVFDHGEAVKVPASIGIDLAAQRISPMHTHFDTGIIHVEAEADEPVTLGQFLTEWGVRVDDDCIGDVCPPEPIGLYVNGQKQPGPVDEFVIKPNLEIALVLGAPPATIPATYDCSRSPQDACDQIPQP